MMSRPTTQADCETLSALLDGELSGDARRFALRRLVHDEEWQRSAARWQLAGDVLRGQPVEPAPPGFADRVAAAVAAEAAVAGAESAAATPGTASPGRPRRQARWIGGAALAASVAMIALLTVRAPLDPAAGTDPLVAGSTGVETSPAPAPAGSSPDVGLALAANGQVPGEDASDGMSALAAAAPLAVAALEAGRRDSAPRPRGQQQRAALRGSRERESAAQVASAGAPPVAVDGPPAQVAAADALITPVPATTPFAAPDEIVSRPWPRALPALSGRSAFTASFDSAPQTAAPSFYPFEPRLPPELREQLGVNAPPLDEPLLQH